MNMGVEINSISLHRIDLDSDDIETTHITESAVDFKGYVDSLVDEMYGKSRFKSYKFLSRTAEVSNLVSGQINENWGDITYSIASRLHKIEKSTQEKLKHLVALRTGSLLQIIAEVDGQSTYIITKIDHSSYLDEKSLKEMFGLPSEQRVQKTALIHLGESSEFLKVSDTNSKISQYWYERFLEAEELKDSESNTLDAFNSIDRTLRKEIHGKSKSDFWTIRNAFVGYFNTRENCEYENMVDEILEGYSPDSTEVNIDDLRSKLKKLPSKKNFDSQFEITPKVIRAKIRNQINLADNLDLTITGEVPNIKELISTGKSKAGRKYVMIYSDNGYDELNAESIK